MMLSLLRNNDEKNGVPVRHVTHILEEGKASKLEQHNLQIARGLQG